MPACSSGSMTDLHETKLKSRGGRITVCSLQSLLLSLFKFIYRHFINCKPCNLEALSANSLIDVFGRK